MKKILYFIHLPPPIHGVTMVNSIIYNSQIINNDIKKDLLEINYTKDITLINKININKLLKLILLWLQFFRKLLFQKPDYIYFTIMPTGYGFYRDLLFVFLIKLFRFKPIYHLHGKGIANKVKNRLSLFLYRWCFSNSDIIHLCNKLIAEDIKPIGLQNTRLHVVENGVKQTIEHSITRGPHKVIRLLFLSNLFKSKGIFVFLKALPLILKSNQNIVVDIVGGKSSIEFQARLESFVLENLPENLVTFHGPQYGSEKQKFFRSADIFVHPTLNDASSLVIMEAMQYSLPIITTPQGAISEIIQDNGILVEENNIVALADSIITLCIDSELRATMGMKSWYRYKEKYTLAHFEKNIRSVFDKITAMKICVE